MADESPITRRKKLSPEERRERERNQQRARYARNRDKILANMRAYRAANPDKTREWERRNHDRNKGAGSDYEKRRYATKDKAKAAADVKEWKAANPDKVRKIWERTYEKNKAKHTARSAEWQKKKRQTDPEFRDKAYAKNRKWRADNRAWVREDSRKKRERRKGDPVYQIMASVRARVRSALKGHRKDQATRDLIGAHIDVVVAHIESLFQDGMTWSNWGRGWRGAREWHLDHVKPLATFDLTDPAQLAQACHYKNLQPLWAADNLKKGGKLLPPPTA